MLIFYEIVYFSTLYTCSKHLYLAQKLFTKAKIAQSGSKCRKLLKSCRAQSGQAYGQLVLPVGDLRGWRFCAGFEMLRMPACQWTLAADPRRLETENRPPLLVQRKTEQYLLKLFDHYFLNWGKMKHLKGKNLSNKPCTAL